MATTSDVRTSISVITPAAQRDSLVPLWTRARVSSKSTFEEHGCTDIGASSPRRSQRSSESSCEPTTTASLAHFGAIVDLILPKVNSGELIFTRQQCLPVHPGNVSHLRKGSRGGVRCDNVLQIFSLTPSRARLPFSIFWAKTFLHLKLVANMRTPFRLFKPLSLRDTPKRKPWSPTRTVLS